MSRIIYLGKSLNSGHLTPSLGWRLNTWDRVWSHRVKTNFSLKFSKEESPIVRGDSQSLVVLLSLAQPGIVHFSGRLSRGSPGQPREEGRMKDELGWLSL